MRDFYLKTRADKDGVILPPRSISATVNVDAVLTPGMNLYEMPGEDTDIKALFLIPHVRVSMDPARTTDAVCFYVPEEDVVVK